MVAPEQASAELGAYWGYTVRVADSLQALFDESPFDRGYDLKLGIDSSGEPVSTHTFADCDDVEHVLLVFGGLDGLEGLVEADESLKVKLEEYQSIFDK